MILVTGASGLLGSNLILTGVKAGRQMGAVTNRHRVRFGGVPDWQLDLTNADAVRKLICEAKPTAIIHCAAQTNLDAAEKDPVTAERINVDASRVLSQAAAEVNAKFIYISTDAVFDGTRSLNKEGDPVHPLSVYGRTKYEGELACAKANPKTLVARINIYGWNAQLKQSLAEWMLAKLEAGESFPGFTDVYFCPMLVNDLADVLFALLDRALTGIYHVCGSERISKHEFGVRVARAFGLDESKVKAASVHDSPLVAARSLDISMSTERVAAAIGRTMPRADEGLRRFERLRSNGFRDELKAMVGE
jgi:dTDP-4-dehydrorhamnose reductase